jgi:hypothetical protein
VTAWERIVEELLPTDGVGLGKIFHDEGLECGGRYFAVRHRDGLLLKLPEPRVQELVGTDVALPFLVGKRLMREWLIVPPAASRRWRKLAAEALAYSGRAGVTS